MADPGESPDPYPDRSPSGWFVADWPARRARVSPAATALVDAATGDAWTYRDLDRAVGETAERLAGLGVGPGDHVGVLAGTRVGSAAVLHAVGPRVGGVLVALNARLSPATLADQVDRADVTHLVCEADTEDLALAAAAAAGTDPVVATLDDPDDGDTRALATADPPVEGERDGRSGGNAREGGPERRPEDPRLIAFTSGTTGDPKPVVLTEGNLFWSAVASAFRLGVAPGDRWLCELPVYHVGGLAPFLRSAVYGTTAVVQERDGEAGFDAGRTARNLRRYGITGVSLVPTQLGRLLDATDAVPDSLRFVLLGGGPAPDELIERCGDRGVPVWPTYGMTETASQIATATPATATAHVGTVGRPLAVTDLTVVGPDGTPVDPGERGELVVDGPTVTPGYYDAPERTRAAFGEFGLHTGDEGHRDAEGRLYVAGRRADRIVTGGENVDPAAVRATVREVEGVDEAAVVGLPDEEWGERVAALVVADTDLAAEALVEAARERLADHERPRTVAFADALPRTASGTVDREAVRKRITDGVDGSDRGDGGDGGDGSDGDDGRSGGG